MLPCKETFRFCRPLMFKGLFVCDKKKSEVAIELYIFALGTAVALFVRLTDRRGLTDTYKGLP
jgi:hypothetical protein